jgi:hypothetical protein
MFQLLFLFPSLVRKQHNVCCIKHRASLITAMDLNVRVEVFFYYCNGFNGGFCWRRIFLVCFCSSVKKKLVIIVQNFIEILAIDHLLTYNNPIRFIRKIYTLVVFFGAKTTVHVNEISRAKFTTQKTTKIKQKGS